MRFSLYVLTVDWHAWLPCRGGDRVEDHAADPVDAGGWGAVLRGGVVGVGGAGDGDPVGGAGHGAHHGAKGGVAARHAERHGRGVHCNIGIWN